ncbi:MAG: hypothetical protein A3A33_03410 [Candidatus Yanofskybacteria bacterium RIFCSPLOWO2_01_FULL_49_25]|uniref:Pilus assembly protein PilO n=1 Tax=Candidatus Yanofskybacteria bacterium RIFCSPLOWO2_01_FULL_49_25 TaxID=1802701 RepID=A0A1F8GTP3_9BACT|nr:MAG: hypothetical protein A3A33_03410 [Candidatus Yanofskybacteria bacterium RIFCSPLOWO2_01_FULL_49_25]
MNKNLIAAIIMGLGGFGFFMFVLPQYAIMSDAQAALVERQSILADSKVALDNINTLNGQFESNRQKVDRVLLSIPQEKRSDYIASSLQNAAVQTGVQLSSLTISPSAKVDGAGFQNLAVTLSVTGRYPDILRLFSALESSLRLYDVQHVEFAKSSATAGVQTVKADIRLLTYSLK